MTGLFGLLISLSALEKGEGASQRARRFPVAGDKSKRRVDTASILRRCRGAYRAKSDPFAEANLARIAIEIKVQFRRMVGPGGGIACVV